MDELTAKASAEWTRATARPAEVSGSQHRIAANADVILPRVTQWCKIAANANATACSNATLRLYRKTRARRAKAWVGVPVTNRKRLAYLKGDAIDHAGTKAVEYAAGADGIEEVVSHPVLDLLRKPNPWMDGGAFSFFRFLSKETTGNAFTFMYRENALRELYSLHPQYVRVAMTTESPRAGYVYRKSGGTTLTIAPKDVMHQMLRPSLEYTAIGESWVHGLVKALDLMEAASDAEIARWENGGIPDYIVELPVGTPPDQVAEVRKQIQAQTRGPQSRGKFLTTTGAKLTPMGSAKEMEYIAGLQEIKAQIWRAADIPESEAKLNDANLASALVGNVQYARRCIAPRVNRDAAELTEYLLAWFGLDDYWFAYDNPVPEDEAAEVDRAVKLFQANLVTRNEARVYAGLDALAGEAGDQFATAPAPVSEAADAPEDDEPDDNEPDDEGDDSEDEAEEEAKAARVALASKHLTHKSECACGCRVRRKDRAETELTPELRLLLRAFGREMQRWLRKVAEEAPIREDGTPDLTEYQTELKRLLDRQLARFIREGGLEALANLADYSGPMEVVGLAEWLETYTPRLSTAITRTQASLIATAVRSMTQAGESFQDTVDAVREAMKGQASWRSVMIARTESARAYQNGAVLGWRQAGIERKELLLGPNPCKACILIWGRQCVRAGTMTDAEYSALAGELAGVPSNYTEAMPQLAAIASKWTTPNRRAISGISENFADDGEAFDGVEMWGDAQTAPFHPNCTCAAIAVVPELEATQ